MIMLFSGVVLICMMIHQTTMSTSQISATVKSCDFFNTLCILLHILSIVLILHSHLLFQKTSKKHGKFVDQTERCTLCWDKRNSSKMHLERKLYFSWYKHNTFLFFFDTEKDTCTAISILHKENGLSNFLYIYIFWNRTVYNCRWCLFFS